MEMKLKDAYVNEVKYQTNMLNQLNKWLRYLIIFSSLSLLIVVFGPSVHMILRIVGIIFMIVSILAMILVGYGIKKGHDNISKIIEYMDKK